MDYAKLRAAALQGNDDEEAVTVDTRALIDKVLARYSGEWTTLRELIQNAADAQATTVTVRWETLPSTSVPLPAAPSRSDLLKHTLSNHTLRRLVVQNDGQPFTKTDWGRLKRIAEGNPDETKIGAFGVGFYSVFADCEEPFISSGKEAMAFYWKGNMLFTKKSQLPEDQASKYTAFVLDYRNSTTPVPNLMSVSQFLATSLTFVALQNIEFWIDDHQILSLQKKSAPSVELPLPRDLEARTREGLMKVVSVDRTSTQIDASYMNAVGWKPEPKKTAAKSTPDSYTPSEAPSLRSFFAKLTSGGASAVAKSRGPSEDTTVQTAIAEDVTKMGSSTIFLRTTSAAVQTKVAASFASELERATKKLPPKTAKLAVLTSSYDETNASEAASSGLPTSKATDVFASVLPNKKPGGRIFIGFPTMQTTGAGLHISAPSVIPTVEREAIDLNARWVRTWNVELLRAAGIVTRLAFANEMKDLGDKLRRSVPTGGQITAETVAKFMPEAVHILRTFLFTDSTPSGQVGQIIDEAFWTCFKKASIETYSTRGVLSTSQVRLGFDELSNFVDTVPVVPKEMVELPFISKLIEYGLLTHITVTDIKEELDAKPLNKAQTISFLTWASKKSLAGELDASSRSALLKVAIATISGQEGSSGTIISLGDVRHYVNSAQIPASLPITPDTIPFELTAHCSHRELQALGWEALDVAKWLMFILNSESSRPTEARMTESPKFAVQILTVISKAWDSLGPKAKTQIETALQQKPVVPTKMGMKKPTDSFFGTVKLFDDLPTIEGCDKIKEKFLVAIGVRKTLDLETIFSRLLNDSGQANEKKKWSHIELIKYLASVQNDIPPADLKKLSTSAFCPAEGGPKGMEATQPSKRLYRIAELFEPKDSLRVLRLPILQWPGPPGSYRPGSAEGRFLSLLGLRPHPSVPELVGQLASEDETLRVPAMTYFIANYQINGYHKFSLEGCQRKIVPLMGSNELALPSACFSNERAAIFDFPIMKREFQEHASKFAVKTDPPMHDCVKHLVTRPPKDNGMATQIYSYLASRLRELGPSNIDLLKKSNIIPIARQRKPGESEKAASTIDFISPSRAYLGSSTTYGDIFDFVDFGKEANAFLFTCGAKSEPTKVEVAYMACSEPARLLSTLQSPNKYLDLLKSLAEAADTLHRDKELWRRMRTVPWLLAYKELATPKGKLIDLEEEEAPIKQYQLASANDVVVIDDIISYRLFKEWLKCAPEEDVLEDFYLRLGAQKLGSLVREDIHIGQRGRNVRAAERLRKHVIERSKIFLYEYANSRLGGAKHDAKWLDKNLTLQMVETVSLRRTLVGQSSSHTEKRSAASEYRSGIWTLYITDDFMSAGSPDYYQVGQALCQMLLQRPNQQAYLFFEPFLALDLHGLRARGYNVERILRAKAAEARLAEEERQRALEAERQKIQEQEKLWNAQAGNKAIEATRRSADEPDPDPVMPGSWGSPERPNNHENNFPKKGREWLSKLSRGWGFDNDAGPSDSQKQIEQAQSPVQAPSGAQNPSSGTKETRSQNEGGKVTNPAVVQQNLLNAIGATRTYGSDSVFSQPKVTEVKEQATYCDETPAHDLTFVAEASNGMMVYLARNTAAHQPKFLEAHISRVNAFASLLVDIGSVYSMNPKTLHIFYDDTGNTIAFNKAGSIFCNFRYFLQLHAPALDAARRDAKAEAATWWWVVIAHELAHNLESVHNANHSYYTESFIQQYFGKMMTMAARWSQPTNQAMAQQPQRTDTASTQRQAPPPYSAQ